MARYFFRDTDEVGDAEFDISGQEYLLLMERCFKYCKSVSFRAHPESKKEVALLDHQLPITDYVLELYQSMGERGVQTSSGLIPFEIKHYELAPAVKAYILTQSNNLWGWICDCDHQNPEDIAFFRADGSIFLYTSIHDGECFLISYDNEHISDILSIGNWIQVDDEP